MPPFGSSSGPSGSRQPQNTNTRQRPDENGGDEPHYVIRGRTQSYKISKNDSHEGLVREYYKRYELDWWKLQGWLARKFPSCSFSEDFDSAKDSFVFYVPRALTNAEKNEIYRLRNDYREQRESGEYPVFD